MTLSRWNWRSLVCLACALLVLGPWGVAQAVVLEGTGQAVIQGDDLDQARTQARRAALRDVALQYEARIASEETMENGVLTDSRLTVASQARARDVRVVNEVRRGNLLRLTIRADMSAGQACGAGEAARMKKRVAVTGFPILYPDQARIGRIGDAGEVLPQTLQATLQSEGSLQIFGATRLQLFGDLLNAPTRQGADNRLTNVTELAKELDVQFVVAGVIRELAIDDPTAWGSSVWRQMQRGVGLANRNRQFVADLIVFDGFSGSPVYRERFAAQGSWNTDLRSTVGFGSPGFLETDYGKAVGRLMGEMSAAVTEALACQPFITRITRVEGQNVTLASGALAGIRPGDELQLYRSYSYFDSPGATPELSDSGTVVRIDNVHPDFSNGLIPVAGGQINIQRNDIAILW
ncbi:flagellar assembly protein T N-terminal domain-containing protein [Marinobacter caseinilyticus]|uniref:flagellar assembly protein T N-terminal domain-containing protein n=1 Tax=Marinobacter caseinilyticus TaxID=2692195 RepID=UPI00140E280F|nr:flagellar assembly protein T N-terminal domain-containing protein [Marinobacter caseinilyticus]